MPTRYTMLFNLGTTPDIKTEAAPHQGGWSESFWQSGAILPDDQKVKDLLNARRTMLPQQANIIGYRISNYTANGNKFVPTGTNAGKLLLRGSPVLECDIPQMALMFFAKSGGRNTSKFNIAAIPDDQVAFGEYQPTPGFKTRVTQFCNLLTAGGWGFVGRDLTLGAQRVISIAANVVTMSALPTGAAVGEYLIFNHVIDSAKKAVKGSYLITAVSGATVTLAGFTGQTVTAPSGTARVDKPAFIAFTSVEPNRIKVRKVGRPFEPYRGRATKRSA